MDAHSTDLFLNTKPSLYRDFPRSFRRKKRYYSGFKDKAQMFAWFTVEELQLFKDNGFTLAMYKTRNWYKGRSGKQLFFVRDFKLCTEEIPLA